MQMSCSRWLRSWHSASRGRGLSCYVTRVCVCVWVWEVCVFVSVCGVVCVWHAAQPATTTLQENIPSCLFIHSKKKDTQNKNAEVGEIKDRGKYVFGGGHDYCYHFR